MDAGKVERFLRSLALWADRYAPISAYSKGMRQKILIAAALLHNPSVIFLDEPFSGLDVTASLILKNLLKSLAADGKIVRYSSHVLEVVERVCSRVIILHRGRVVADDSVERLRELMKLPSLAVISWDALFPDRRDAMILSPLPLKTRTVFLAKLASLAAVLLIFAGAINLLPEMSSLKLLRDPARIAVLEALPPLWFLRLYEVLQDAAQPVFPPLAKRAVWALAVSAAGALLIYAACYRRHVRRSLEAAESAPAHPSHLARWSSVLVDRWLVRRPAERACFHFILKTLARSRHHRLFLAGYLGVGLAGLARYRRRLLRRGIEILHEDAPDAAVRTLDLREWPVVAAR